MQCNCPNCSALTIQVQRGLESHCVCPTCGWICNDCMGGPHMHFSFMTQAEIQRLKERNDIILNLENNDREEV